MNLFQTFESGSIQQVIYQIGMRMLEDMPELKVGDMVTVVVANREVHLRATKVLKDKPVEAKPD